MAIEDHDLDYGFDYAGNLAQAKMKRLYRGLAEALGHSAEWADELSEEEIRRQEIAKDCRAKRGQRDDCESAAALQWEWDHD